MDARNNRKQNRHGKVGSESKKEKAAAKGRAVGGSLAGDSPFPDMEFNSALTASVTQQVTLGTSSHTEKAFLFSPNTDAINCVSANSWNSTWSGGEANNLNAQLATVGVKARPVLMTVEATCLLDADTSPITVHVGQIPNDTLSTDLGSLALAKAVKDHDGKKLDEFTMGPGDRFTAVWVPRGSSDELSHVTSMTTTSDLGDVYSDSIAPYSRILIVCENVPASVRYITFEVTIHYEYSVESDYTTIVKPMVVLENPQLAALTRGVRRVVKTVVPQGAAYVTKQLREIPAQVAARIGELDANDVETFVGIVAGAAGIFVGLVL